MGLLRFFLALIVFINHFATAGKIDTFISGALAVRIFYLISGFYIQLVILKYDDHKHWKRNFYLSRSLRLFPTYFLMLHSNYVVRWNRLQQLLHKHGH